MFTEEEMPAVSDRFYSFMFSCRHSMRWLIERFFSVFFVVVDAVYAPQF